MTYVRSHWETAAPLFRKYAFRKDLLACCLLYPHSKCVSVFYVIEAWTQISQYKILQGNCSEVQYLGSGCHITSTDAMIICTFSLNIVLFLCKFWLFLISGNLKGKKLIEIGSGPTIYGLISASKYFEEMVVSDFTDSNRREIEMWLRNEEGCFDWRPVIQLVCELEGRR